MICCPTCGSPTSVSETRRTDAGARRRRCCDNVACNARVTTYEVIVHQQLQPGEIVFVPKKHMEKLVKLMQQIIGGAPTPTVVVREESQS